MDWLAADRVGIELMGIDYANVGYMNFCNQTGLGIADMSKIQVIGESVSNHKKVYKLSDNFKDQLIWKNPVSHNVSDSPKSNFRLSYT
jgi:cytochrome c oxidase assembly protein Cox11